MITVLDDACSRHLTVRCSQVAALVVQLRRQLEETLALKIQQPNLDFSKEVCRPERPICLCVCVCLRVRLCLRLCLCLPVPVPVKEEAGLSLDCLNDP